MEMKGNSNGGASSEEQEAPNSTRKGKKPYHRHTNRQIQMLELFFKECPHPDENQRRKLSKDLGLEPKQIKFWFQNKRTQTKAQCERADNSALHAENERIRCENIAIREALKNVICPSCGGPPFGEVERQRSVQKLQLENAKLKEEHERVSSLLAKYIGKPISLLDPTVPMDVVSPSQGTGNAAAFNLELNAAMSDQTPFPCQLRSIPEMEKTLMSDTALGAFDELLRLLRINEPLWTIAQPDGKLAIHRESYDKIFPRQNHFSTPNARIESSKGSGTVPINATSLVEMFFDSSKWMDLFPTIVTKACIIQVLETGTFGNRNGALQLMYEQLHILSPLVPSREFYILRFCQQPEPGTWVIADISYNCLKERNSLPRAWKLPSGCMIQEMPNGFSKVTWVEHVEVDDKTQTHRLYRDLICGNTAYGAERWIVTLERMCERLTFPFAETSPPTREIRAMSSDRGKRSLMRLAHRMVKNFCATLSSSGKLDFPQLSEVNNSGVRVSIRKSSEIGQPSGIIVTAATSLWLPLPPLVVFAFFRDEKTRTQWDILSNGNPVHELSHISTGAHQGNDISIIRPFAPAENAMLMLQESFTNALGSLLVYAPMDMPTMQAALAGDNSLIIPILPSGFVITGDGRPQVSNEASTSAVASTSKPSGSLLTVAYQILVSSTTCSSSKEINMESIATVNTLISSTVQNIKVALNCNELD